MTSDNERALKEFDTLEYQYSDDETDKVINLFSPDTVIAIRTSLQRDDSVVDMAEWVRLLLPLAKGYVHANPGIRSTEIIIEDAENCISKFNASRGKK